MSSKAHAGSPVAPRRSDPTRTKSAKLESMARRQARSLKGWTPAPFNADTLALELVAGTK